MANREVDWRSKGFSASPKRFVSGADGMLLYRCWGNRTHDIGSTEWGTGYFSAEKPSSVLDAELRFNVVDWDNGIHFVSTFRLKANMECWIGPVAHGERDYSLPGLQVWVEPPLKARMELIRSKELLRHDVFVSPKNATA